MGLVQGTWVLAQYPSSLAPGATPASALSALNTAIGSPVPGSGTGLDKALSLTHLLGFSLRLQQTSLDGGGTTLTSAATFPIQSHGGVLNVATTTGVDTGSTGILYVPNTSGVVQAITYTSATATQFKGCSGGTGSASSGAYISAADFRCLTRGLAIAQAEGSGYLFVPRTIWARYTPTYALGFSYASPKATGVSGSTVPYGSNTLTDTSASWGVNAYAGQYVSVQGNSYA